MEQEGMNIADKNEQLRYMCFYEQNMNNYVLIWNYLVLSIL